jgi:threonylcarbamoyladenosine tRNA methylthiotransferase CDKAL1
MLKAYDEGVKEIWMTSEDTGAYGLDIGSNISELLIEFVEAMPDDLMLRIGMTNPPYILDHLHIMDKIINHPRVFGFLHVPVQSGSDTVLERMNREYTAQDFKTVCSHLMKNCPQLTIGTDIICGFPGETDAEHKLTLDLLDEFKIPVVNISQFYPRPGTIAARMKQLDTKSNI